MLEFEHLNFYFSIPQRQLHRHPGDVADERSAARRARLPAVDRREVVMRAAVAAIPCPGTRSVTRCTRGASGRRRGGRATGPYAYRIHQRLYMYKCALAELKLHTLRFRASMKNGLTKSTYFALCIYLARTR